MPLAVLVDQNTSGSGEWIAAALQDNHAAVVVGERTAGNFYVPSYVQLPGEDEFLQVATGIFERPRGMLLQRTANSDLSASGGIVPDRIIKSVELEPENAGVIVLAQQFASKRDRRRAIVNDPIDAAVRELASRLDAALANPRAPAR
jgi:carboxyl-terminal processing protease